MLDQPDKLDKAYLRILADREWEAAFASNRVAVEAVTKHFQNLLAYNSSLRRMPANQALVDQARRTIPADSIPRLVYSFIKVSYANDADGALHFDGLGMDQVFKRKSGASLAQPMPSLYTKKTFDQIVASGAAEKQEQFDRDQWVWGARASNPVSVEDRRKEVLDLYALDYTRAWDGFLSDFGLASLNGTEDLKRALRALGGSTSPLRRLLKIVDDNTHLKASAGTGQQTSLSKAQETIIDIINKGKKAAGLPISDPAEQVTSHFAPIHTLLAGDPGTAPIDGVIGKIKELQEKLEPVGSGIGQDVGNVDSLAAVGRASESLKQSATGLPEAVGSLIKEVGNSAQAVSRGGLSRSLNERYQTEVVRECSMAVKGRYPFVSASTTDVPMNDFGRIFGYSGVYDNFYKQNLQQLVDNSGSPWKWRSDASGEAVGLGPGVLSQFEQAQRIRDTFFKNGSQSPELAFTITFNTLSQVASRVLLELDGQQLSYRFEAPRALPVKWPGPNPGTAVVTFEERGGNRPHSDFKGAWALFRLIDSGQMRLAESSEKSVLTFKKDPHSTEITIDAGSVHNPFGARNWQKFSCGG
jgi:type VI secretion system protein ImpL